MSGTCRRRTEIVDRMLDVAKVRTGDVVYDLGCGDGRMVIAAAKKFGTRGVGVDLDPARIREARANAKQAGRRRAGHVPGRRPVRNGHARGDGRNALPAAGSSTGGSSRSCSPSCVPAPAWSRTTGTWAATGRRTGPSSSAADGIYLWVMPPLAERAERRPPL